MNSKIRIIIILLVIISLQVGCSQKNSKPTFTAMTYNIASGHNPSGGRNENLLNSYFKSKNLDIIGLNEVDINTHRSNNTNQLSILSNKLKYNSVFSKTMDFEGGYYGDALLTKYNILHQTHILLYNEQNSEQRSLLHTVINIHGTNINVLVTHLEYNNKYVRTKQLEYIKDYIQGLSGPIILMGDFNVESPSELDILTSKLNVIYGSNNPITYPSDKTTLDYILYSNDLSLVQYTVDKKDYSDHYPVWATFSFKKMPQKARKYINSTFSYRTKSLKAMAGVVIK